MTNYQVQTDEGDSLILLRPGLNGRTQLVSVRLVEPGLEAGDDMITWLSPVARTGEVSADQVLAATIGVPFGVVKTTDFYWLMHSQLAATVDPLEIDIPMRYVATYADHCESKFSLSDNL